MCLVGGIVFAGVFFIGFGSAIGYPWYWALICLGIGLFFAVTFYFVWLIVEKLQKPFSFENPKAQKKLLEYDAMRHTAYECKFSAYINYGKGLKQEVCEASIYFEPDHIHIAFCHFGKIYGFDVPYGIIESTSIEDDRIFVINTAEMGCLAFAIKNDISRLRELLMEKGMYKEGSDE
jgi:hypothetical protein